MRREITLESQIRLVIAGGLNLVLLLWGLDRLCKYSTWEAQMWFDFWLAVVSSIPLVALWPVLWRGRWWPRIAGALLCLFPLLTLYAAVADHFQRAGWLP